VPLGVLRQWVRGLDRIRRDTPIRIVSLLGTKDDGYSEFAFYPFRSQHEQPSKPTFQEWLDAENPGAFVVYEFPTVDAGPIDGSTIDAAGRCVASLLAKGETVVVVDSAGVVRSSRVCTSLGYRALSI
jgi:hypothetical protein